MSRSDRREFLTQLGAAAVVLPELRAMQANRSPQAQVPEVAYDLLIAGGHVIDPSQKLSGVRDVAVAGGRIARVAPDIPRSQARQVFDASGKIVTPGLIDMHTHVYEYGIRISIDSNIVGIQSGVTTVVDTGSAGALTFPGFRKYVIDTARTRIYALLNISTIGLVVTNELYLDPDMIDAKAAMRMIGAHRDRIVGIKIRVRGRHGDLAHDLGAMKTAREVADATGLPIMMHWSVEPELLSMLKPGDILSHPFNPPSPNSANVFGADGRQAETVLPQIRQLADRGVWTDGQLGTTHHSWEVSEKALGQGWVPDTISTDYSRAPDGSFASVLVPMSEFLHLGLTLEQVIERVTTTPARVFNFPEKLGTLEPGVVADVAVLELARGDFEFRDGGGQARTLSRQFVPVATVKSGVFVRGSAG